MDQLEKLYKSYDAAMAEYFENTFKGVNPEEDLKSFDEAQKKWAAEPVNELSGITPGEYFAKVQPENFKMEIVSLIHNSDFTAPMALLLRLQVDTAKASEVLTELLREYKDKTDEESLSALISIIDICRYIPNESIVTALFEVFDAINDESIHEKIAEALAAQAPLSLEPCVKRLKGEDADIDIFGVVAEAGSKFMSDELYKALRNAFKRIKDKSAAALYMANYGDGRAVTFLRGYIEKNVATIEKEEFFHVTHAIEKLGGVFQDLVEMHFAYHRNEK